MSEAGRAGLAAGSPVETGLRIGIDLVAVARIARAHARFGDRFLRRIFTDREVAAARGDSRRLAGRWAAKEAVLKALPVEAAGVFPRDIEVTTTALGAPAMRVPPPWDGGWLVSISHEHDFAAATAVWVPPPPSPPYAQWLGSHEAVLQVAAGLPPHRPTDEKRDFGPLMVVAGSLGYTGAAYLSATAAARAGAGLVELLVAESIHPLLAAQCHEVIVRPISEIAPGVLGHLAADRLAEQLAGARAALIGPGLGRDASTRRLTLELVRRCPCAMVVDADALNAWAEVGLASVRPMGPRILTPHAGEAARLLARSREEVQRNRAAAVMELSQATGQVVILKGAETLVAAPGEAEPWRCGYSTALLASAGTGDILAGAAAGLLAQGAEPAAAARAAVLAHSGAAWLSGRELGDGGLLASDLLLPLARSLAWLRSLAGRSDEGKPPSPVEAGA